MVPPWEFHYESLLSFPLTAFSVQQAAFDLHQHWGFSELVVVTRGSGKHLLEGESFEVKRGDAFVIPADRVHGYAECRGLELINILYDPSRLLLPDQHLRQMPGYHALFALEPQLRVQHDFQSRLQLDEGPLTRVEQACALMHSEVVAKRPGFEVALTGIFYGLLVELSRYYVRMQSPTSRTLLRLSGLLEWLERHSNEPVTVALMARRAHMSQSTLGRCFHECFGVSPLNYVIDMRLRKAAHALRETESHVKDIAASVGIDDANYFARIFRRHTGLEPSAYRSHHRSAVQPSAGATSYTKASSSQLDAEPTQDA